MTYCRSGEMADTLDSKSGALASVWVQVPPSVPTVINYRYLVIERQKLQKKAEKERFFAIKSKKWLEKSNFGWYLITSAKRRDG